MGASKNPIRDIFWPKYAFHKGEASHPQISTNPQRAPIMPTIKGALCPQASNPPSSASNCASSPRAAGTPLPKMKDIFGRKAR